MGFHTHHMRFTDYAENPTHHETIAYGLDYAADILADRVGVFSRYSEGSFLASSGVDLPAVAPEQIQENAPMFLQELYARADAMTIRSWSSRFDLDFGNVAALRRKS